MATPDVMNGSAIYVYCVVKSARQPSTARLPPAIPQGSAPEALDVSRSLWLIVSEVPLAVYGPDALEPKLRDLDWVSRVAVMHESIVESFARARRVVVAPMKLFTMFSSRARAVEDVGARRRSIVAAMQRIAGCEEWGVRISRAGELPAPAVPRSRTTGSAAHQGAGAAFLVSRKASRDAALSARRAAATAAGAVFSRLSAVAKDVRQRPASQESGTNRPLLEAAFLVRASARASFRAEARRQAAACAAAGATMTLTGPWPAYSFVASVENER